MKKFLNGIAVFMTAFLLCVGTLSCAATSDPDPSNDDLSFKGIEETLKKDEMSITAKGITVKNKDGFKEYTLEEFKEEYSEEWEFIEEKMEKGEEIPDDCKFIKDVIAYEEAIEKVEEGKTAIEGVWEIGDNTVYIAKDKDTYKLYEVTRNDDGSYKYDASAGTELKVSNNGWTLDGENSTYSISGDLKKITVVTKVDGKDGKEGETETTVYEKVEGAKANAESAGEEQGEDPASGKDPEEKPGDDPNDNTSGGTTGGDSTEAGGNSGSTSGGPTGGNNNSGNTSSDTPSIPSDNPGDGTTGNGSTDAGGNSGSTSGGTIGGNNNSDNTSSNTPPTPSDNPGDGTTGGDSIDAGGNSGSTSGGPTGGNNNSDNTSSDTPSIPSDNPGDGTTGGDSIDAGGNSGSTSGGTTDGNNNSGNTSSNTPSTPSDNPGNTPETPSDNPGDTPSTPNENPGETPVVPPAPGENPGDAPGENPGEVATEDPTPVVSKTIKVKKPSDWDKLYIHYWGTNVNDTTWPGNEIDAKDGDYYIVTFDDEPEWVIFNNNNAGKQTGDINFASLTFDSSNCCVLDYSENIVNLGGDFIGEWKNYSMMKTSDDTWVYTITIDKKDSKQVEFGILINGVFYKAESKENNNISLDVENGLHNSGDSGSNYCLQTNSGTYTFTVSKGAKNEWKLTVTQISK